jgi:membrane associated rhomboid family serine protease
MGIYERDYYRREGPSFLGSLTERGQVCKWLIAINVVCFLIQLATVKRFPVLNIKIGEGPFTEALALNPDEVIHGEVWRLLTHAFLHSTQNPWHIVINMFVLWWAGSNLEERYGWKEFLALYLTAAVVGGITYTATMLGQYRYAVGASGAVMALLVIFACHDPHRTILLFFVIPMPVWLVVFLLLGHDLYIFASQSDSQVAVTAHLGGGLFGFLYYKWHWHLTTLLPDLKAWRQRRRRPQLRVYRGEPEGAPPAPVAVTASPPESDLEHLEAKLDAVLEKMSLVGKENLTESEREILLRASEIYRKRRT